MIMNKKQKVEESTIDFTLTDGERAHPLWLRLKGHFEKMLRDARARNDDMALTEIQTAAERGRIKLLKGIIALGNDRPVTGQ